MNRKLADELAFLLALRECLVIFLIKQNYWIFGWLFNSYHVVNGIVVNDVDFMIWMTA